tara:strand:+ start:397 stop:633 length:237 start_codon:yes stop_codon:yes gene_type:complete
MSRHQIINKIFVPKEVKKMIKHKKLIEKIRLTMYCPETKGSFKMMFGFKQPTLYRKSSWTTRQEKENNIKKIILSERE